MRIRSHCGAHPAGMVAFLAMRHRRIELIRERVLKRVGGKGGNIGMSGDGTVSATIFEGAAQDAAGNLCLVSTSLDTTVTFAPSSNSPMYMLYLPMLPTAP